MSAPSAERKDKRRLEGVRKEWIERGRSRLLLGAVVFAAAFLGIALRLVELSLIDGRSEPPIASARHEVRLHIGRADITDRNGALLATSLPTASLFADPGRVLDPARAAQRLVRALPYLEQSDVEARLSEKRRFVWLARHLTPDEQYAVNRLGIPGLEFQREESRTYPMRRLASHLVGYVDIDGNGLAGAERAFDDPLRQARAPLALSLDIRVQEALHGALARALVRHEAVGAAGLVLDAESAEILGLVSLPDFDPNRPAGVDASARFNRITLGTYEMGSTFKIFTTAMALDAGTVTLADGYDTREPIRIAHYVIRDYHAKRRWLSIPEIFIYSSNIGAAKMARDVGIDRQQDFLDRLGLLDPAPVELREVGTPLLPSPWREVNALTIAFGHGLSVTPLQLTAAVAAIVNGGVYRAPSIVPRKAVPRGRRVVSAATSERLRRLLRLAVVAGTGRLAAAPGYVVGGKTGSSEKVVDGRYRHDALISSFIGAFPMQAPRYVVFAMLDEPKGDAATHGFATGGWIAAPVVREVIERIAPQLGIGPVADDDGRIARDLHVEISAQGGGRTSLASY